MSAITAGDYVRQALLLNGAVPQDTSLSASDLQDGLFFLRNMLEAWEVPYATVETFPFVAGQVEYTIGPLADFDTDRPTKILSATSVDSGGIEYEISIIDYASYSRIGDKDIVGSFSEVLWFNPTYPLGTIYFYPAPAAGYSLKLTSEKEMPEVLSAVTLLRLPPGYARAITFSLSMELSHYSKAMPESVPVLAAEARRKLQIMKSKSLTSRPGTPFPEQYRWRIMSNS